MSAIYDNRSLHNAMGQGAAYYGQTMGVNVATVGSTVFRAAIPCANVDPAQFPDVDPGRIPVGTMILYQLAKARTVSAGGIILSQETRDVDQFGCTLARCVAVGDACFKVKDTGAQVYGAAPWVVPGDYVEIPAHGGSRFKIGPAGDVVVFVFFRDTDIISVMTDARTAYLG